MGILHTFARAETADRKHIIGASAAPVILGLSPWQTPMGLWLQMQSGGELADNPAMQRGRFLEDGVLRWTAASTKALEVESGIPLAEPGIAGPEAWMQFHPDGALRYENGWRLAEIKTARRGDGWGESGTDQIPLVYLAQVQYQLACCPSLEEAQVGAYIASEDTLHTHVIASDREFQRFMVDKLGEWVYRHIVLGKAPDIDGTEASAEWLHKRFPKQLSAIRDASEAEAELAREFAVVKAQLKLLEEREALLANQLRDACREAEGLQVDGLGKLTWRHVSGAETVDAKRLRAEHPDVWESVKRKGQDRRDLRFWPAKG